MRTDECRESRLGGCPPCALAAVTGLCAALVALGWLSARLIVNAGGSVSDLLAAVAVDAVLVGVVVLVVRKIQRDRARRKHERALRADARRQFIYAKRVIPPYDSAEEGTEFVDVTSAARSITVTSILYADLEEDGSGWFPDPGGWYTARYWRASTGWTNRVKGIDQRTGQFVERNDPGPLPLDDRYIKDTIAEMEARLSEVES
jgi:hypothetical protein